MTTRTYEPPDKAGCCETCDEPSQHLQEADCWNCQRGMGLLCEDCYRRYVEAEGSDPQLCTECAEEEDKREQARLDHLAGDNDRAYDAWKDSTLDKEEDR